MRLRHFGTLASVLILLPYCIFIATATDEVAKNVDNKPNTTVSTPPQNVNVSSTSTTITSATTSSSSTSTTKPTVKGSTENHLIIEDSSGLKKNVTYGENEVKDITLITSDSGGTNSSIKIKNITPINTTAQANNQSSTSDSKNPQNFSSTTESPASSTTTKKPNVTTTAAPNEPILPEKGSAEAEHNSSMAIFFVLCVLAIGIVLIHFMLMTHFQYLPESVVIVFLGALIGLILNLMSDQNIGNWRKEEAFSPTAFFLVLLPPIIFESGYNLHKGNFFQNIGSILVFAIAGTTISALVIGAGIYLLGLADVAYRLSFMESFAFGSLISAVDPVATVAIFHALDIDPVLNMLVFGESILNDAIAIVLTTSVFESGNPNMSSSEAVLAGINRFCLMFFASAGIGVVFALISALLLKHVDLRKNPSLEFGMMLVFTYAPYALAEGIHLSGIMAILFCGIVMSHYTHYNLSTVTQITMQQTMRTLSFIAETCVFAYLGLAIFSFKHRVEPALVVWSLILCLIGRACNIFPLAILCNKFREHKITKKMMFIMWFSGLRGAISYALSLHLEFSDETRHVIITTTLIIVLVTTLLFGGSTMPLMKLLQGTKKPIIGSRSRRKRKEKALSLSKTKEWGQAIDSEHLSEYTEEETMEVNFIQSRIRGFAKWDLKYFIPFFTRRFTQQELKDCKSQMTDLTNQWYQAIRISPNESDEEQQPS
ncbi:sodium/hydrogen exchanger 8 isoform X2 [Halyomorpha halys]|uniref:sodium/hydrogen exchanger 8 isoform X2 n=1 Tax=Halyomorpha halys TaxID=286706 RepID=UPI0006D51E78|nr:sodium/hydrogen exchanger 8 isoform X2 [Halyomorpha halys]